MKTDRRTMVYAAWSLVPSEDYDISYREEETPSNHEVHTHDYYEFYFFRQGSITMHIDGTPHALLPGDMIIIPPGTPHFAVNRKVSAPYKRFVLWISQAHYRELTSASSEYRYLIDACQQNNQYIYHFEATQFNSLQAIILRNLEEIHSPRFGRAIQLALNFHVLFLTMNRLAYEQDFPSRSYKNLQLYEAVLIYIDAHLTEDLTLDRLSEALYVSKYHIAHSFKENLGVSVHSYITKKRLDLCRNALVGQDNIGDIYLQYGFRDYTSFYRAFKKEYGMSPQEFKKHHHTQ